MGSHMYTRTPDQTRAARLSRRTFLVGAAGLVPVAALTACGGRADCSDVSTLPAEDAKARREHHYIETSPDPEKACNRCEQWAAGPDERSCGACKVLKGPINPIGNCDLFAKKA